MLSRPPDLILTVVEDPVDGVLYARTEQDLYRYRPDTRTWQVLAPPPRPASPGASCTLVGRRLYSVSTDLLITIDIYDIETDTWASEPYLGLFAFATDGANTLYAVGPGRFVRIDLVTGNRVDLTPPRAYFQGATMRYVDGALYLRAYGYDAVYRYDIASQVWTELPTIYGLSTSGTVDLERGVYIIASVYGIWRWEPAFSVWEQESFNLFTPAHVAWLPGSSAGLFVLGNLSAPRMARLYRQPLLDLTPKRGTVPAGGVAEVVVNLRAASLRPGEHRVEFAIDTNAPGQSSAAAQWPLTLQPTSRAVLGGEVVTGGVGLWNPTTHQLDVRATPAGDGTLDMMVDGFGGTVSAEVAVEGTPRFTVTRPRSCGPVVGAGVVPRAELSRLAELGVVTGTVTMRDGFYCAGENRNLLVLRYPSASLPHDFGSVAVGESASVRVRVANTGSSFLLRVRATSDRPEITSDEIFAMYPEQDDVLTLTWKPTTVGPFSARVSVVSEDRPVAEGTVSGVGLPPAHAVVAPQSVTAVIAPGGQTTRELTLRNDGGSPLRWRARVARTGSPPVVRMSNRSTVDGAASALSLEQALFNLDEHASAIAGAIPDRFDFLEGIEGSMILDGGEHMYEYGNVLYTPQGSLDYSDGVIRTGGFAGGVRYFTRKVPGLFVFAGDLPINGWFTVTGTLGNQGTAIVDRTRLSLQRPEGVFAGYVKRVHGGSTPSVNHLFLVADADLIHFVDDNPASDYDELASLPPDGRVYYLLFASREGGYVSDSAMTEIANRFLDTIHATPWLWPSPQEGVVPAGESRTVSLQLDASSLAEGLHRGLVTIESNDPIATRIDVPVALQVGSALSVGLRVTPRTINPHARGNWVTACVFLPPPLTTRDVLRGSARLNGVEATGWPRTLDHGDGSSGVAGPRTIDAEPATEGGLGGRDDEVDDGDLDRLHPDDGVGHDDDDDGDGDAGHDHGTPHVLTLKFDRAAIVRTLQPGERVELTLTATLSDGRAIEGRDTVRVLAPGRRAPSLAADIVLELALGGAVPNPFGASTTIEFALPRAGPARLEVYDLAGRRVRTLADGSREPGRYSIPWDGTDAGGRWLAAGVYVLRLEAAGSVLTRRVVRLAR